LVVDIDDDRERCDVGVPNIPAAADPPNDEKDGILPAIPSKELVKKGLLAAAAC
jgi:hypothetical protein